MEADSGLDWELAELDKLKKWAKLTDTDVDSADYKSRKAMIAAVSFCQEGSKSLQSMSLQFRKDPLF